MIDLFSGNGLVDLGVSTPTAAALLAVFFAVGAVANVGRSILMRISGQRIVARLREAAYTNVLRQVSQYDRRPAMSAADYDCDC